MAARRAASALMSTCTLAWVRVGEGLWSLKIACVISQEPLAPPWEVLGAQGGGGGGAALKSFLVNRLNEAGTQPAVRLPQLSEFRKEHTIIVSATFYFVPG